MNVLNKIKSKKAKEPLRITDDPPIIPTQAPPKQEAPQAPSFKPSIKPLEERRESLRGANQWRRCEQEIDEASVSEYFSKKDKEKRLLLCRGEGSDVFREEDYKQSPCLNVKKGYTIGGICLFEGEIVLRENGREQRRRKMSVSCGVDAVSFPESIAKIILSKVTFISEEEAVFLGEDIIRVIEKGYTKK